MGVVIGSLDLTLCQLAPPFLMLIDEVDLSLILGAWCCCDYLIE